MYALATDYQKISDTAECGPPGKNGTTMRCNHETFLSLPCAFSTYIDC